MILKKILLFWIWFRKTLCCNHSYWFPQKIGKKEKIPHMNRNSCLIVEKLEQRLCKKIHLACYTSSIRIHNVWISSYVLLLCTWSNPFACEWKKAKLYSKVHEKEWLIGCLIGQTPYEPLSPFIFSLNINSTFQFSSVKIVSVVWSSKLV